MTINDLEILCQKVKTDLDKEQKLLTLVGRYSNLLKLKDKLEVRITSGDSENPIIFNANDQILFEIVDSIKKNS